VRINIALLSTKKGGFMTDLSIAATIAKDEAEQKPLYERPTLQVMNQDEVLQALQMSANEISAAGCWWGSC
jgi:hypothetical protein